MTSLRVACAALALVGLAAVAPAAAQVGGREAVKAQLRPGADVYGRAGIKIGTIESVAEKTAVLVTKTGPLTIQIGALGPGIKGLYIDRSASQLADMVRAEANRAASPPA